MIAVLLIANSFYKLFFFPACHIQHYAVIHHNLPAITFNIFIYQVFIDNIRMMNTDRNRRWQ